MNIELARRCGMSIPRLVAVTALAIGAPACQESQANACEETDRISSVRAPLYYASDAPEIVVLSRSQQEAILAVEPVLGPPGFFCTATVVAPGWVLTAAHCNLGGGMIVQQGPHRSSPTREVYSREIWVHATEDVALVRFPALDGVEPVALFDGALGTEWVGAIVQLAGFGQVEDGASGARRFVASTISAIQDNLLETHGEGRSGACIGDSGGPLLVLGHDGLPKVAGVLSSGSSSCVELDRFTRVDAILPWATNHIGSFTPPAQGCGLATAFGSCQAGFAIWCQDSARVVAQRCPVGTTCGWVTEAAGVRCVAADDDACAGFSTFGACDRNMAVRCVEGTLRGTDCSGCGKNCGRDPATGEATCF